MRFDVTTGVVSGGGLSVNKFEVRIKRQRRDGRDLSLPSANGSDQANHPPSAHASLPTEGKTR
ncbi:hypothetical protein ACFB49_30650 [Sphingomonas sp. DBB INV C78]|uniref:hypothetical protein n=1 Tax=Sphingomonas sp. DBB INV C78 TaxID=3349434 RepID=UPI0036D43204